MNTIYVWLKKVAFITRHWIEIETGNEIKFGDLSFAPWLKRKK